MTDPIRALADAVRDSPARRGNRERDWQEWVKQRDSLHALAPDLARVAAGLYDAVGNEHEHERVWDEEYLPAPCDICAALEAYERLQARSRARRAA